MFAVLAMFLGVEVHSIFYEPGQVESKLQSFGNERAGDKFSLLASGFGLF
jgi:hypothetical protein